jgi:hypothetical protein
MPLAAAQELLRLALRSTLVDRGLSIAGRSNARKHQLHRADRRALLVDFINSAATLVSR